MLGHPIYIKIYRVLQKDLYRLKGEKLNTHILTQEVAVQNINIIINAGCIIEIQVEFPSQLQR